MEEPRRRHYARLPALFGWFERARHLSIARAFLGRDSMKALGLPAGVLPWYPILTIPFIALWHLAHRLVPGGRARLARRGRERQEAYLKVLFGARRPDIATAHPLEQAGGHA
jgi:hypothetical protein